MRRLVVALIFLVTWGLTTHGKYSVTGDEPHYLMVTQSLVSDGDIDVANNYQRDDGARFGAAGVKPETHIRLTPRGRTLPVGDIGMPVLLVPVFAAATALSTVPSEGTLRRFRMNRGLFAYSLISLTLIALTTAAAAVTIRALQAAGATGREAAITVAIAWLSPPVLSHAFLVFAEPFALFVTAWVILVCSTPEREWGRRESAAVVMLGLLPWVHRKFAIYVVVLLALVAWRRGRALRQLPPLRQALLAAAFVLPPVLLILWSLYEWGSLGGGLARNGVPLSLAGVAEGIPGLLLDRENGLIWWAPVYVLLGAAFWLRRRELWIWLLPAAALIVPAAAHQWWAGFSPAGRFLVPLVPMFCLIGYQIARQPVLRAAAIALLVPQVIMTAYAWQHPRLLWVFGDGENRVLAILLPPLGRAYRAIPSFRTAPDAAWIPALVLLTAIVLMNAALVLGARAQYSRK